MKQTIWISYDLGIKGDYPNLYKWLDTHKAKECGNSVAYFSYEFQSDILTELLSDLQNEIDLKPGDRIYVVTEINKEDKKTFAGKYIYGNRKGNPWEGYAQTIDSTIDS